jgi:hypothetical protein
MLILFGWLIHRVFVANAAGVFILDVRGFISFDAKTHQPTYSNPEDKGSIYL